MRSTEMKPHDITRGAGAGRIRESGFTLLELLVAMAIFMVVVGAIYAMLEVGRSDAFLTKQKTETMQNARIALNTIGRDAVNAGVGYWKSGARVPDGTLSNLLFIADDADSLDDWLTPVVPGDGVRTTVVDGVPVQTDALTFAYMDNAFNGGTSIAVSAVNPLTNTITVASNSVAVGGNLYVYIIDDGKEPCLASLTKLSSTDKMVFEAGDPLQLNNPGGAGTFSRLAQSASLKRITWVTYFVNDDNVLIRRVYGQTDELVGAGVDDGGVGGVVPVGSGDGIGFVEMPLAFGVENFQVRYVMDDGTIVDDIVSAGGVDASIIRQNIRLVQVDLSLRGTQNDPKTGQPIRVQINGAFHTPNLVIQERAIGRGA